MKKILLVAGAALVALVLAIVFLPRIVWAVIGWVLLAILGLLLLLLVLPVTVKLSYSGQEGLGVRLRVLFLSLSLFPVKEKPAKAKPKKKKPKAKAEDGGEEKKEKPKKTVEELILLVKRLAAAAGTGLKIAMKSIRFREVELVVPVSGQEPHEIATGCGRMQAIIGGTRAVLANVVNIRYKRLQVIPDYEGIYGQALFFSCKILATPGILVIAGAMAFARFLSYRGRRGPGAKGAPAPRQSKNGPKPA